jgi:molecular chaperone HtpG
MKETKQFQTETKKLLDMMIHSIYTHKEIFLRELISNASDAIDKLKFKAISDTSILGEQKEFYIEIIPNKENRTITIKDNGIGMTKDEVIANIGTIPLSFIVIVLFSLFGIISIKNSFCSPKIEVSEIALNFSLSIASLAFDISSLKNISL